MATITLSAYRSDKTRRDVECLAKRWVCERQRWVCERPDCEGLEFEIESGTFEVVRAGDAFLNCALSTELIEMLERRSHHVLPS